MSKYIPIEPMKFAAVQKWRDGSETVIEYFRTKGGAWAWIQKQAGGLDGEWEWCVGEFEGGLPE
jgi:hypothetical protein